jgi:DNA-binding transcriptional ArsR family regulator
MLDSLSPGIRLHGHVLEVSSRLDRDIHASGLGVVLMPTSFWTGPPLVTWDRRDPAQCVIIYRAQDSAPAGSGDALAALLGTTRADVLRALVLPLTTTGLAKRVWISVPSASQHATALRGAGLITSRRDGKIVEHRATSLGLSLLRSAPFGPR